MNDLDPSRRCHRYRLSGVDALKLLEEDDRRYGQGREETGDEGGSTDRPAGPPRHAPDGC